MERSWLLAHLLIRYNILPDGAQMLLQPRNKRVIGKARDPNRKNSTHLTQEYIVRPDLQISTAEVCSASSQNIDQLLLEEATECDMHGYV